MQAAAGISIESAERNQRNRRVEYVWKIGEIDGGRGGGTKDLLAVLTISHHKAGYNLFNGEHNAEDYFGVTLGTETREVIYRDGQRLGESRGFKLFSALGITKIMAGNRYSAKKLRDAEAEAVALFERLVAEGNHKVLSRFNVETAEVNA